MCLLMLLNVTFSNNDYTMFDIYYIKILKYAMQIYSNYNQKWKFKCTYGITQTPKARF